MIQDEPDLPSLLPPRPNPGPEPWPADPRLSAWWLTLLALPVLVLAGWRFSRRSAMLREMGTSRIAAPETDSLTPAERLARLADAVRDQLADQFGPTFAAMTTEEIVDALRSIDSAFPREVAANLLSAADRAKFADAEIRADHLAEAEAWAAPVFEALADGARSRMNGR